LRDHFALRWVHFGLSQSYEGLFLGAHVAFEGFIEDLFVGLLVNGLKSQRSDIVPRIRIPTHQIARELLTGPRKRYVDWLPFERTIDLANLYFRGGRPFTDLSVAQKDHLERCNIIRNAIAHKSRHSLKLFEGKIISNMPLPPKERSPSGYLRGIFRISPLQTRFQIYISQTLIIARDLAR